MRAIKNTTVTYSFNDKIYTSNPITEPVEINSENAEQMGSVTGSAVKITAGDGVELINVPENGYTLPGANIRYTYEGKTYLTEPVESIMEITAASGTEVKDEYDKYLFVNFVGKDNSGDLDNEKVYFSVSSDAIEWNVLNGGEPVLESNLGTKGVRDPHIVRSPEGDKFYIVATDLFFQALVRYSRTLYVVPYQILVF